jgi:hypothetical protein
MLGGAALVASAIFAFPYVAPQLPFVGQFMTTRTPSEPRFQTPIQTPTAIEQPVYEETPASPPESEAARAPADAADGFTPPFDPATLPAEAMAQPDAMTDPAAVAPEDPLGRAATPID